MKKLFFFSIIILITVSTKTFGQTGQDTIFYNRARQFSQQQIWDSAIVSYTQTININPSFVSAIINRGFCYFNIDKPAEGLKDFDIAISVSKHKYRIVMYIGNAIFNSENYDTAFIYFHKAFEIAKDSSEPYFKMGRCLWLKRLEILKGNNVEDYSKDTALNAHLKKEILFYYDKAIYIDSVQNYKYYLSDNRDAISDENTNYEYYYDRALFEGNFYEWKRALADYEMSIQIHPTIDAFEYAAYIAKTLGQKEKACSYIQTWATMFNPSENIDIFKKHEIADKFCKDLGQTFDKNTPLPFAPLSQNKSDKKNEQ